MNYLPSNYLSITQDPGVYIFKNDRDQILYVGKASNLKNRLSSYFQKGRELDEKTQVLVSQVSKIETISANSEIEAFLLEATLIKKYLPKYNIKLADGKTYYRLKITVKDEFPKILLTRNNDDNSAVYFGPFPSSSSLKLVLKTLRKIFPYISVKNHSNRICLYYHLGLCPCPVTLDNDEKKAKYKKDIKYIVKFLNGRISDVIKDIEVDRDLFSKDENFEKAMEAQKKINAIKIITSPFFKPFAFEVNPLLASELRIKEITDLKDYFVKHSVTIKNLTRIECFDISNTSGTNATGSMVVFTNGDKNTNLYRRFKIKNPPKVIPNDFEMMREVIRRRLNHIGDWGMPSLIIVDGGKGQVSSAKKSIIESGLDIPLIGLAKKKELIVTTDFLVLRLPRNSDALNLITRIRDEAHRFAIAYHRKLRSKATFF